MQEVDKDTLRKAQLIMLESLVELDKICVKHDIRYWLDFGTLLGAVRHKGFIPWDDDLDVSMPLDDYNRFCKVAQSELPQHLFLQNFNTDKSFPYDYSKIRNNKGQYVEKHETGKDIKYNQGIFIDIFPAITIPSNPICKLFYRKWFLVIRLFSYTYLENRFLRGLAISIFDKLDTKKYNHSKIVRSGRFPLSSLYIDSQELLPLKKIEFENINFFVPQNTHSYLVSLYGEDYMTLPPKDKRKTHAHMISIKD